MPGIHTHLVRTLICLLCISQFYIFADGQSSVANNSKNLIANPSFEDINICSEYHQPCSPSAWFFANRKVTSGYFPRYPSASGQRHLQIVAASRESSNRQYWETRLLCPLTAGEKYTVNLKVSAFSGRPNLRDVGFWFTDRFIFSKLDTLLQPRIYLRFTDASVKDLKNGWFEITKEFTPAKNAAFLIIGNFYGLSNTDIMDQRQKPSGTIEFGIDDVSIVAIKSALCPDFEKRRDSLYAILRRHSDVDSGEPGEPGETGGISNAANDTVERADTQSPDTLHRTVPQASRIDTLPRTDTLVIHNIQFQFDRYLVDNPDTLQRFKAVLTRPGIKKVRVVGYTDDKGTEAYNQDLSEKRAREVGRLLTTKFGIPAGLIEAEGRGISRDYKEPSLNRRVEIYIYH
jgi:outer membrane protein OmpA-like peptidoglycan-associated protein